MAFVPDSKASVRLYAKYQRYARVGRLRYSAQKTAWLNYVRSLSGVSKTLAQLFPYLRNNTADSLLKIGSTLGEFGSGQSADAYTNISSEQANLTGAAETPGGDAVDSTTA